MLELFAKQNKLLNIVIYSDDGFSGTSFNRPNIQKLLDDAAKDLISTIIVKDLSRFGRNYLETGIYLENYFPEKNIRFIAIDDGVDSLKGTNEFMPFRNIINEWYAKDISKKIKSAYRTKALKGEYTGTFAPYGYRKNPENKNKLIVHEETSIIVKLIFEMASLGKSPYLIAKHLTEKEIKTPRVKIIEEYNTYYSESVMEYPYYWKQITVRMILLNKAYLGHLVAQKSQAKSYKCRKIVARPKEEWVEVKNTHEPIIDETLFEIVHRQLSIKKNRKVYTNVNLFVGRIKCADCGRSLNINFARGHNKFSCSGYRSYGPRVCSIHYIKYEKLYEFVLNSINEKTNQIFSDSYFFINNMKIIFDENSNSKKQQKEKSILSAEERISEINSIIKKLYEDNYKGIISDESFVVLSGEYEAEQKKLKEQIIIDKKECILLTEKNDNSNRFLEAIEKYKNITELDENVISELIDKIVVYESDKSNGTRTQKIEIYYNFIGKIN